MESHRQPLHDFRDFFQRLANQYCVYAKNLQSFEKLLVYLDQQVEEWLRNPPKNPEYALSVMRSLMEVSLPQGEQFEHLNPLRAKLIYISGRIREKGFASIKQNQKNAKLDFVRATELGNLSAWDALGDITLRDALSKRPPVYNHAEFHDAVSHFSHAGNLSASKLLGCFETMFHHAKNEANFAVMFQALEWSLRLLEQHPELVNSGHRVFFNPELLHKELSNMRELQLAARDAVKISAKKVVVDGLNDINTLEKQYLRVRETLELPDTRNPINDYYYANILLQVAKLSQKPADEKNAMRTKANELLQRIKHEAENKQLAEKDRKYPPFMRPLLLCAYGMGIRDHRIEGTAQAAKNAFSNACAGGAVLAYYHLACINLEEGTEQSLRIANEMMRIGARAKDPTAMVSYIIRMTIPELKRAEENHDLERLVSIAEEALKIIDEIRHHPHIVQDAVQPIIDAGPVIIEMLRRNTTHPKLFAIDQWTPHAPATDQLVALLNHYQQLPVADYHNQLATLHRMQQTCQQLHINPPDVVTEMQKQIKTAIYYVGRNQYYAKLRELCQPPVNLPADASEKEQRKARAKARLRHAALFMNERGHLQLPYYLEHLDPLHRKPEFRQAWLHSPDKKDFFTWLASFESYRPDEFERIVYLRPDERDRYRLTLEGNQLCYAGTHEPVKPDTYLFVMDKIPNLFIASEVREIEGNKLFHHSTFLSGEPVLAAGEVTIENGKITKIANYSGHYQPGLAALLTAYAALYKTGMLSQEVRFAAIGVFVPKGVDIDVNNMTVKQVEELLALTVRMNKEDAETRKNNNNAPFPQRPPAKVNAVNIPRLSRGEKQRLLVGITLEIVEFINAKTEVHRKQDEIFHTNYGMGFFAGKISGTTIQRGDAKATVPNTEANKYKELSAAQDDGDYVGHLKRI